MTKICLELKRHTLAFVYVKCHIRLILTLETFLNYQHSHTKQQQSLASPLQQRNLLELDQSTIASSNDLYLLPVGHVGYTFEQVSWTVHVVPHPTPIY